MGCGLSMVCCILCCVLYIVYFICVLCVVCLVVLCVCYVWCLVVCVVCVLYVLSVLSVLCVASVVYIVGVLCVLSGCVRVVCVCCIYCKGAGVLNTRRIAQSQRLVVFKAFPHKEEGLKWGVLNAGVLRAASPRAFINGVSIGGASQTCVVSPRDSRFSVYVGVSENRGTVFWDPNNKDLIIWGIIIGRPVFGTSDVRRYIRSVVHVGSCMLCRSCCVG